MTIFWWPLLFLVLSMLSCSPKVQSLKCYVCDMKDCAISWVNAEGWDENYPDELLRTKKKYLLECKVGAVSCASFSVDTKDPYSGAGENWFQRICLYPGDLTCIGKDPQALPSSWPLKKDEETSVFFPDWVSCINSYRKENSIPEMKELPSDSLIRIRGREINLKFQVCTGNITDSCNFWDGFWRYRTPVALAEGFPMDLHQQMKKGYSSNCYECNSEGILPGVPKNCEKNYKKYNVASAEAYGCTMLAIYYIAGGFKERQYFQRGVWFPGDHWCLQKQYNSTGTGRNLGNKVEKPRIRYAKRSNEMKSCTQTDYSRALKERDLSSNYEWIGQIEFNSVAEFADYVNCREHVTNKLEIYSRLNRQQMEFNESAANAAWSGKSGVFASVGFLFCGPKDFCNDWTEHELYQKMDKPPSTSTTLRPVSTTPETTTVSPTTKGDGCYKEPNTSPSRISFISNWILLSTLLQTGMIPRLFLL